MAKIKKCLSLHPVEPLKTGHLFNWNPLFTRSCFGPKSFDLYHIFSVVRRSILSYNFSLIALNLLQVQGASYS